MLPYKAFDVARDCADLVLTGLEGLQGWAMLKWCAPQRGCLSRVRAGHSSLSGPEQDVYRAMVEELMSDGTLSSDMSELLNDMRISGICQGASAPEERCARARLIRLCTLHACGCVAMPPKRHVFLEHGRPCWLDIAIAAVPQHHHVSGKAIPSMHLQHGW